MERETLHSNPPRFYISSRFHADEMHVSGRRPISANLLQGRVEASILDRIEEIAVAEDEVQISEVLGFPSLRAQSQSRTVSISAQQFKLAGALEYSPSLMEAGIIVIKIGGDRNYSIRDGKIEPREIERLVKNFQNDLDFLRGECPEIEIRVDHIRHVILLRDFQEGSKLRLFAKGAGLSVNQMKAINQKFNSQEIRGILGKIIHFLGLGG